MNKIEKRNSILGGLVWRFSERILAQGVTFIVSLVIARILEPQAYGFIAIVMVFIIFADAFVTGGFGNALIQKKDSDALDFSTVFYFNCIFSLIIYAGIYISAPYIEIWYGLEYKGLSLILQILAIRIPISAINSVQQAFVSKNMMFKKFFFSTLGGTLGAAVIGVVMAYLGYGVWALVFQYLFNTTTDTLVLWITVKWRPKLLFSYTRLIILIKYGWKLMIATLLEVIYNDLRTVLIGKFYNSNDLAYYNRGKQFPGLVVDNINTSILTVMFPAICAIQNNEIEIKKLVKKAMKIASYIIFPMLIGLAIIANKLVIILLTDKWIDSVWYIQIFCIIYLVQPITKPFQQIIKAKGRSDITLFLQIITKILGILGILIAIPFNVKMIAIAHALTSLISVLLDMIVGGRMINYSIKEQIKDLLPTVYLTFFMGIFVYGFGVYLNSFDKIIVICCQVIVGILLYIFLSKITKNENLEYIIKKIKKQ